VTVVAMDVSAEPAESSDEQLVRQLVERARAEGLRLTGETSQELECQAAALSTRCDHAVASS
jgi:hypothetical protein